MMDPDQIILCEREIKALLAGTMTQKRVPLTIWRGVRGGFVVHHAAYAKPGKLLWVAEEIDFYQGRVSKVAMLWRYRADGAWADGAPCDEKGRLPYTHRGWRRSRRYMAHQLERARSRFTLEITRCVLTRARDISTDDVRAEAMNPQGYATFRPDDFGRAWNQQYSPIMWSENPEVAVLSFNVHRANISTLPMPSRGGVAA